MKNIILNPLNYCFNKGFFLNSLFDDSPLIGELNQTIQYGLELESDSEEEIDMNHSQKDLNQIFQFEVFNREEKEIDPNVFYYINNSKEMQNKINEKDSNNLSEKNKFFSIEQKINLSKNETTKSTKDKKELTKEKRKRGRKKSLKKIQKKEEIHDAFSEDNACRKIRVDFLNFCVLLTNDLLKYFQKYLDNNTYTFLKLNNDFKKKVNNTTKESLKNQTLGDIINNKISSKYKNYNENTNIDIYKKIKNHELLKEIFSLKYYHLFKIYYKSKRIINLKDYEINEDILNKYDLNKEIKISKDVKFFNDLLENNDTYTGYIKENNILLAQKYKNYLKNCAIKYYLFNQIFLIVDPIP